MTNRSRDMMPSGPSAQRRPHARRSAAVGGGPRPGGSGPRPGRVRITPLRVTLLIALAGGLGFLAYATFVRDQLQVPLMATGLAILGLVMGVIAVLSIGSVVRAGREGRDGAAVITALLGGLTAAVALLLLAGAAIMSLIWSGTGAA
jgi:hypothetical protein